MAGAKPSRLEICPDCGDEFVASPFQKPGVTTWWKTCPSCQKDHRCTTLVRSVAKDRKPHTLGHHPRAEGLSNNHLESLEIALKAMLCATDRLLSQLPVGAPGRAQVEALFKAPAQLARELVA